MTSEAIARHGRPLPFAVSLMALRAVGKRMHSGEGEARSSVNLERFGVIPALRRMATVATVAEPRLMRILVAFAALSGHTLLAAVAAVASHRLVPPGQGEPGSRMIEAFPSFPAQHLPAGRGMAIAAIQPLGNRVVTGLFGARRVVIRVLGDRDPDGAGKTSYDNANDERPVHRCAFLRA
jgi:hypothetical protein